MVSLSHDRPFIRRTILCGERMATITKSRAKEGPNPAFLG
jgi:hypothetical protein